ncbi:hypothetical protein AB0J63_26530 [Streptosporangium canum]|uniref:hypothetical protein n=1 Tax=Streptosporangium canum TaxID=324952 RepID=UPI00343234AB
MNARIAAAQARRELAFLEVCEGYQDRLEAAKDAVRAAQEGGDEQALAEANAQLKVAAGEMHGFRSWARSVGKPREGVPGRDAVIQVGG